MFVGEVCKISSSAPLTTTSSIATTTFILLPFLQCSIKVRYGLVARICRSHLAESVHCTVPARPGFDSRCRKMFFLLFLLFLHQSRCVGVSTVYSCSEFLLARCSGSRSTPTNPHVPDRGTPAADSKVLPWRAHCEGIVSRIGSRKIM